MRILKLFAYALLPIIMWGCEDNEPEPMTMEPVPIVWQETMSMEDFVDMYDSGTIADDNIVLRGNVTSTDEYGNSSNVMYVEQGGTALSIRLASGSYYERYPIGTDLYILVTGLSYTETDAGRVLTLDTGITAEQETEHINVIEQDSPPFGNAISDLNGITLEQVGTYVRIFGLQFDDAFVGEPLQDGLVMTKSDGSSIRLAIDSGADFGIPEVPYASGTVRGILGFVDGAYTVRPISPEDLTFTGSRHSIFTQATYEMDGFTLPYQIMYPSGYDPSQSYPLIIFLHGAGERGSNNTSQMANGPNTFANQTAREDYPAIVVFPQCPSNFMWSRRTIEVVNGERIFSFPVEAEPDVPLKAVIQMTRDFIADGVADADRIYVMGLSMGGIGTLEYCYYAPDLPAAAISLAGGHDESIAFTYGEQVSIRLYAGANDGVVPARFSEEVFDAVRFLPGADIEYFLDPNRGHEWNYILNDASQVLPWLWTKTK